MKRLLDGGADVNAFGDDGLTPLHSIVSGGDVPSAVLLIDRGAGVNVRSQRSSVTPITTAKGPATPRPWENTPLHVAVLADRPEMIKLLLSKRAAVNSKNSIGQTPLRLARSEAVAKLLREAGGRDE